MKLITKPIVSVLSCFALFPAILIAAEAQPSNFDSLQALQQLQQLAQQPPAQQEQAAAQEDAVPAAQDSPAQPAASAAVASYTLAQQEEEALSEAAFRAVLEEAFPLTPEQILRYRQMYDAMRFAQSTAPKTPPKPIASSQFIQLAPGSTPPVVRLSEGFVSSLVFLDSTGAPWPLVAYDLGNPDVFNVQWDRSGNILMIQATEQYTYGNMAIRLQGLNTPVMLTLVPGQKVVDYRVDMRVQGTGPNAKAAPAGMGLPADANPTLLNILEGVAPPGARVLRVVGGSAEAWLQGDRMYVRTRLTVLSPGWLATMRSADGTHAYEMSPTSTLLVYQQGEAVYLKIERV